MPIAMFHISDEVQAKLLEEAAALGVPLDQHVKNSFTAFINQSYPALVNHIKFNGTEEELAAIKRLFNDEQADPRGLITPFVASKDEAPSEQELTVTNMANWAIETFKDDEPFTFNHLCTLYGLDVENSERILLASKFAALVRRGGTRIIEAGKNSSKAKLYKIDK